MKIGRLTLQSPEDRALLASDRWSFIASTSHTNFPVSKILVDNLADVLLCYGNRRSQCWISGVADLFPRSRNLDYLGAIGTNRTIPEEIYSGYLFNTLNMFRAYYDNTYPLIDRIRPEVTALSLTNLTGSISSIYSIFGDPVDPPQAHISPDYVQSKLTATNPALATVALVTFANHYATERALDPVKPQTIKVHVRHSSSVTTWPSINVTLRQNSVDLFAMTQVNEEGELASSGVEAEQTNEGYIFTYQFSAGLDLPSQTLPIQIRIDGTSTGGGTPELIKVEWFAELAGITYDSDWIILDGVDRKVELVEPEQIIGADNQVYTFLQWSDHASVKTQTTGGHLVKVYRGLGKFEALEVGKFLGIESIEAALRAEDGFSLHKATNLNNTRVYSSDMRSNRFASNWWEADLVVCAEKQAKIFGELENQFNALGLMQYPTLFIPDENDLNTALWAVLGSWEAPHLGLYSGIDDEGQQYNNEEMYELAFSIVEKTGRKVPR